MGKVKENIYAEGDDPQDEKNKGKSLLVGPYPHSGKSEKDECYPDIV
jgi:hypothetical protein